MYKILISYNSDRNLWQQYGTTTSNTSDGKSIFTEFVTDDIEILKTEILKLDKQIGYDQIKIYKDVTANYSVDFVVDDTNAESESDKDE